MSLFRIDMLPGLDGDCLWIEYGDPARPRRILIDGGRKSTYATLKKRFAALPADQCEFELLVLSHVDADHIGGLLKLIDDPRRAVRFKDVWFNGQRHLQRHLQKVEGFGAVQGEAFTKEIATLGGTWNEAFDKKSVVIPDDGSLPVKVLEDGMRLTLLSPIWDKLEDLAPVWETELRKAALGKKKAAADKDTPSIEGFGPLTVAEVDAAADMPFERDRSAANGSSICLLADFDGRRVALGADGHAEVLTASLARLGKPGKPIELDAYKLSHHGSQGTHSVELMQQMRSKRFMVSTNGSGHEHPHLESIARTLKYGGGGIELCFNYQSQYTSRWNEPQLKKRYGYKTVYPNLGEEGLLRTDL
jgi:beta-lactamase superfamily II metal-dependent hydrolase